MLLATLDAAPPPESDSDPVVARSADSSAAISPSAAGSTFFSFGSRNSRTSVTMTPSEQRIISPNDAQTTNACQSGTGSVLLTRAFVITAAKKTTIATPAKTHNVI